jgi:hypothetical protein
MIVLGNSISESIKAIENEMDKAIQKVREEYSHKIGEEKKKCNHNNDDGSTALVLAGYPFHSGWDRCQICGAYIETNEYSRGDYLTVEYQSDMGIYDGLTKGKTYQVINQNDTQYIVKNDLGATSTINKSKFVVIK